MRSGCSAVMYALFVAICALFSFLSKNVLHRGESSRATRIGAAGCISPSARKAFWPSRATPLSQSYIVIHSSRYFCDFHTFLCIFSISHGVRRFGASLGRPGRLLNRSVPSGLRLFNCVKGALAAGPCLFFMFT